MVIDETADVAHAARNTRMSKTSDNGSGCSADGNPIVDARLRALLEKLQEEGGHLCSDEEKAKLKAVMWDETGARLAGRTPPSPAPPATSPRRLVSRSPTARASSSSSRTRSANSTSSPRRSCRSLSIFKYEGGFDTALKMVEQIYEVGGKGHSCRSIRSTTITSTAWPWWRRSAA